MRTARLLATFAVPALIAASAAYAAQPAFPDKPIRLIIGSAPGSGPDIMARLIADHLHGVWGQRVVVDARPGVAGIISAEQALQLERDYALRRKVIMVDDFAADELRANG